MTKRARQSPRDRRRSRAWKRLKKTVVIQRFVESPEIATGRHTGVTTDEPAIEGDSFFWPELQKATLDAALSTGRGGDVKRLQEVRLELEAIKKNYNIPDSVKARMVFEAGKMMVYSKVVKEKFWAIKLLKAMEDSNHRPSALPAQITVNNQNMLTVNALLREFGKDLMDPSMDLREVKAIPGSPDDYAD